MSQVDETKTLNLEVFDSDEGKKDDRLGSATIDLKEVFEKGKIDKTVPLSTSYFGFSSQGEITVKLEFTKK
ncbi:1311_t:CDS:2 [Cetraspora pellucida]|uniref:1311_t:CDS:1 n=1 Tax=Cetraspora pellucida TaxID=1433469 RepID=A0ACA9K8L5_9GLOM|nr:1311_t:CDS:2 [Cetraspora pellucida]